MSDAPRGPGRYEHVTGRSDRLPERRRVVTPDHVQRLESKVDALVEALSERSRDPDQTARFSILPPAPGEPRVADDVKRSLGWGWFKRHQSTLTLLGKLAGALGLLWAGYLGARAEVERTVKIQIVVQTQSLREQVTRIEENVNAIRRAVEGAP